MTIEKCREVTPYGSETCTRCDHKPHCDKDAEQPEEPKPMSLRLPIRKRHETVPTEEDV